MEPNTLYRELLDHLSEGVYFVDKSRIITHWNSGAERITGYAASEVVGKPCHDNILRHVSTTGEELCLKGCPLHSTIVDGARREIETVFLHHHEGHRVPISVTTLPVIGSNGEIEGAVEIFSDGSSGGEELQRRVADLRRRLLLDSMTQLSNRDHVSHEIRSCFYNLRANKEGFGILFIDIDHFKSINDTYGHDVGDQALKVAASTLRNNVRPDDTVARWGGEEFVAVFPGVDHDGLHKIAEKMQMLVRNSKIKIEEKTLVFTVSIGATLALEEDDLDSLVKRADRLMYQSKKAGRDTITLG